MTDISPLDPLTRFTFPTRPGARRLLLGCFAVLACALGPAAAQEPASEQKPPRSAESAPAIEEKIPSFAELEAAGARIGEIHIKAQNIFDLEDERESNALYRAANTIHIQTRRGVLEDKLLFRRGERVSVRLIEETERLLRANRFLYDVSIVPVAYHDAVVDIEVRTRDTWTLQPGLSASRAGGSNRRGATLRDTNALGTGILVGVNRSSDAERTATEYRVSHPHAFDGWTIVDYSYTQLSDGENRAMSVTRPFYALDTRWAAGVSASKDNRINTLYGTTLTQFRHRQETAEAFGGWSEGLVDSWVRRYSVGVAYQKDTYNLEPDLFNPAQKPPPPDQTLAAPFFRYEIVQDSYEKYRNLDLIERPEYFAMGFQSSVQLGRAWTGFGSTQNLWLYSASASDGFRLPSGGILLSSVSTSGQSGYSPIDRQSTSSSIRFYSRPDSRSLFFVSLSGDVLNDASQSSQLLLGGDNGLRGYPRNYQSGDRRALLNVESRVYTDWYPFRLFRVGGAVFYDLGRASGGPNSNTLNTGWLNDVGLGLRILSARSTFGNVLHIDFAFPLNRDPNIKPVQFLVTTKITL